MCIKKKQLMKLRRFETVRQNMVYDIVVQNAHLYMLEILYLLEIR